MAETRPTQLGHVAVQHGAAQPLWARLTGITQRAQQLLSLSIAAHSTVCSMASDVALPQTRSVQCALAALQHPCCRPRRILAKVGHTCGTSTNRQPSGQTSPTGTHERLLCGRMRLRSLCYQCYESQPLLHAHTPPRAQIRCQHGSGTAHALTYPLQAHSLNSHGHTLTRCSGRLLGASTAANVSH